MMRKVNEISRTAENISGGVEIVEETEVSDGRVLGYCTNILGR